MSLWRLRCYIAKLRIGLQSYVLRRLVNKWRFFVAEWSGSADKQIEFIAYASGLEAFRAEGRATRWLLYCLTMDDEISARRCIEEGGDVNSKVLGGRTPLIIAAMTGSLLTEKLIKKGAHLEDEYLGITPLGWAARQGHLETVKTLISFGADVNARIGPKSYTPLVKAAAAGQTEAVEYLLDAGAKVNGVGSVVQRNALMEAAKEGHHRTVQVLIDRGADMHAKDCEGKTALDLAVEGGHENVVQLFQKA